MTESTKKVFDPRIVRTRQLLQQALHQLLQIRDFDSITVQDIAEAATVNRATFYDHYNDKFSLLECMVASRFQKLLQQRGITFSCDNALQGIAQGVCDYLATLESKIDPHMESAVIAVVRRMFLDGLVRHPAAHTLPPEIIAATAAWAIYGAAKEWLTTPNRCPTEQIVEQIAGLVKPILGAH
jgi:AcrR family transcriptional regulator